MPSLPGLCVNRQDSAGVFQFWLMRSIAVWQSDRFVIISGSHSRNERCMQLETSKKNSDHGVKATKVKTSKRNAPVIHTIHMCICFILQWMTSKELAEFSASAGCPSQLQAIRADLKARAIESHAAAFALEDCQGYGKGWGNRGELRKKKSSNHPKLITFALLEYRYDSHGTMLIWIDFIGWKWNDGCRMERPCKWYSSQGQHQPVKAQLLQCVGQAVVQPGRTYCIVLLLQNLLILSQKSASLGCWD